MYDASDPRSMLGSAAPAKRVSGVPGPDSHGLFYAEAPAESDANGRHWYCRAQNFVVHYAQGAAGGTFERRNQLDEYMVVLNDPGLRFAAEANGELVSGTGPTLIVMPPGDSSVTLPDGGDIVRLVTTCSADLAAKASNAENYAEPDPAIPPFEPWPDPVGGFRIRTYPLDVPEVKGRLGRIYRCTTIMLNLPGPYGARDTTKVSPHSHDTFEQGSLVTKGLVSHHLRWPWGMDMASWRDDVHITVEAPSLTIIPAGVTHTSVGWRESNQLADIFCPPRLDFSGQPGWVLNEDEYPLPEGVEIPSEVRSG